MADSDRVLLTKETIRRHLKTVGPTNWAAVRSQYPDISDATFWRYVKAVREETRDTVLAPALAPSTQSDNADSLPPAYGLPDYYDVFKKGKQYESLLADVEVMKDQAVDHRGKITNRVMYERSIILREKILREQALVMRDFLDMQSMELFYEKLLEVISEAAPDVQKDLIERLDRFNRERPARADSIRS